MDLDKKLYLVLVVIVIVLSFDLLIFHSNLKEASTSNETSAIPSLTLSSQTSSPIDGNVYGIPNVGTWVFHNHQWYLLNTSEASNFYLSQTGKNVDYTMKIAPKHYNVLDTEKDVMTAFTNLAPQGPSIL